jgi:hypothetical protein
MRREVLLSLFGGELEVTLKREVDKVNMYRNSKIEMQY